MRLGAGGSIDDSPMMHMMLGCKLARHLHLVENKSMVIAMRRVYFGVIDSVGFQSGQVYNVRC